MTITNIYDRGIDIQNIILWLLGSATHANTPTQVWVHKSPMPNLSSELWKTLTHIAFVSMYTNRSSDFTNGKRIILVSWFCLMKFRSTSTCLVLSCWTGLWKISIAVLLSQNKFISLFGTKSSPVSNLLSQRSLQSPLAIPQNSASTFDNATTFCFFTFPCDHIFSSKHKIAWVQLPIWYVLCPV